MSAGAAGVVFFLAARRGAATLFLCRRAESDVNFGAQADKDGRYILNGHVGQQLIIEGRSDRQYVPLGSKFEPMERCETVRVTLEKPQETIRVVITKLR